MRNSTLARWLVIGSLAGLGLFVWSAAAEAQTSEPTSVQQSNTSDETEAGSGDASASNDVGTAQNGDGGGQVVQEGDNSADIDQSGEAQSGDAAAGSQITGIVSGGDTSVVASNTSSDAEARSGDATVRNTIGTVNVGPRANGADVSQTGDNEADVSQSAVSTTGDAVAGAQVTGIVTSDGGSAAVVLDNDSEDASSESGDGNTSNDIGEIASGPATDVEVDLEEEEPAEAREGGVPVRDEATPEGAVPLAVVPAQVLPAQNGEGFPLSQIGDNEADVDQSGSAASGDAVAGGQVTGLVASEFGSISVVNRQSSEDDTAESGEANSSNTLGTVEVGPRLDVTLTEVTEELPDGGNSILLPVQAVTPAQLELGEEFALFQEGDNSLDVSQEAGSATGDAVAGSQVVGVVATGGANVGIALDNTSEDSVATTGDATATNTAAVGECVVDEETGETICGEGRLHAGPVLSVDAEVTLIVDEQLPEQAVNVVVGGPMQQIGDNEVDFSQRASAASRANEPAGGLFVPGDAVAGAQVVGVVANGGNVGIVATNSSEDASSETGAATASNTAATGTCLVPEEGPAQCADGSITAGPRSELDARIGVVLEVEGLEANADITQNVDVGFAGDFEQIGDNEIDFDQSGDAASGDAVAGGQVFGVVSDGGSVGIVASNASDGDEATSGEANVTNTAATGTCVLDPQTQEAVCGDGTIAAGPSQRVDADITANIVVNGGGNATITQDVTATIGDFGQTGDNELDFSQSGDAASGDAVAGGQVFGVVATDAAVVGIVASNTSEDSSSESGEANVSNVAAAGGSITSGPTADLEADVTADVLVNGGGNATIAQTVTAELGDIAQTGDNELDFSQSGTSASGDAVGGGQVIGVVASGGVVAIDATNTSEDAESESGAANVSNVAATDGGSLSSGPSTEADVTVVADVVCNGCGTATITQDVTVALGDFVQTGDNELDFEQSGTSFSGDAVAGGQVFGVVSDGGDVAIVASNSSDGDSATSGSANVTNTAATGGGTISSGPTSDVEAEVFVDVVVNGGGNATITQTVTLDLSGDIAQTGDNELDFSQSGTASSGDAVGGAQVIGVVASDGALVAIDATNTSEDSETESGSGSVTNVAATDGGEISAGPSMFVDVFVDADVTVSGGGNATILQALTVNAPGDFVQTGDNALDFEQSGTALSGDAVAGGQVIGVVADGGTVAIVAENTSEDASSESGSASVSNAAATGGGVVSAGPSAALVVEADFDLTTAGGQDVRQTVAVNVPGGLVQTGDNELDFEQSGTALSGDAVAGGQVFGVVSDGGDVAIDATNLSEDATAESGNASVTNTAATDGGIVSVGPGFTVDVTVTGADEEFADAAVIAGGINQTGDNSLDVDQGGSTSSGDAVAGAQVTGVVASGIVDVVLANDSDGDESLSGEGVLTNDVGDALIGPFFAITRVLEFAANG